MIRATVAQVDPEEVVTLADKIRGDKHCDSETAYWAVRAARTFIQRRDQIYIEELGSTRQFSTGATRDSDAGKLDFDGFLSPLVLRRYAEYMHSHRKLPDGSLRASDNWKLGIDRDVYMKSLWRHFFAVWEECRGIETPDGLVTNLCALLFNASGMLHEVLKAGHSEPVAVGAGYTFPLADKDGD